MNAEQKKIERPNRKSKLHSNPAMAKYGLNSTVVDRFWKCVERLDADSCWNWGGWKNEDGYGKMHRGGRNSGMELAHRVSWLINRGEIPEDRPCVLHKCDNPACVNPDHLFCGTKKDNAIDCGSKGRSNLQRHPENAPRRKLTTEQVLEIRRKAFQWRSVFNALSERVRSNGADNMESIDWKII